MPHKADYIVKGECEVATNDAFRRLLRDSAAGLAEKEICAVLDAELQKPPNIADAQLIDFCLCELQALQAMPSEKAKGRKQMRFSFRIAAIAAILLLFSVGGYAAFTQQTLYDGLADMFEDYAVIYFPEQNNEDREHKTQDCVLTQRLAECGIDNALLPEEMLSGEIRAEVVYCMKNDVQTSVQINLDGNLLHGQLLIFKYADTAEYDNAVYRDAKQMKHMQVNGVDFFVFLQADQTMICYTYASCYYQFSCDLSLKAAEEFVKTIK